MSLVVSRLSPGVFLAPSEEGWGSHESRLQSGCALLPDPSNSATGKLRSRENDEKCC